MRLIQLQPDECTEDDFARLQRQLCEGEARVARQGDLIWRLEIGVHITEACDARKLLMAWKGQLDVTRQRMHAEKRACDLGLTSN